ncbi:dipeptidyl-peptidase 3 family protein [Prevotella sp. OH937_COT-195]|uniref:dipeptidyl-peptidase 3 family protein n=1 Tax=Prevotella sp. OH937_COT-195 TaxID=2491051 RepID=UPI000F654C57|nr:dihydrofolate reductase [Prevotella sp. OH937_COT-195]RRC99133.1 dihydrofolate reductase [Prevotella sp. OH937_COT-195]
MDKDNFCYVNERFADLQLLRYRLNGFEELSLQQKKIVYYLSEATLYGRDITFDQFGKFNLKIRKTLEAIYLTYNGNRECEDFKSLVVYLKRVWFSNGIYHHYGCEKIIPDFPLDFFKNVLYSIDEKILPLANDENIEDLFFLLKDVMFNPNFLPKRVNKAEGEDVIVSSACNFYENVTQQEVEDFYNDRKKNDLGDKQPISYGLNSKLIKEKGIIKEIVWKEKGMYGSAISHIISYLEKALEIAENDKQKKYIKTLVSYYKSGDLRTFNKYCIEWVDEKEAQIDFVNGFIEVYGDPLGLKGSWESIVEYKDIEATVRTQKISNNAQWFENNSPVSPCFRKKKVKGVTANVVCAAMLGGDEYPSTAIGINLPNADWIRAEYGSKSVTIGNLTEAYNKAARGNGFMEEFVIDKETLSLIEKYGDICEDLHTDLHECLGHGSGQLLKGVDPDALKSYGNTIEEARADLFALYYIADYKLVELGLTPDEHAYKSQYYTYIMNGLLTQLTRIKPGNDIEETHMRNRALIAYWCYENGNAIRLVKQDGKTFVAIDDYSALRSLFAKLLAEIQRIKSEGDYSVAKRLVEKYSVKVDKKLHFEIIERYKKLNLAPYKGFLNPVMKPVFNDQGDIMDIKIDYTENYTDQMLRYSRQYATLI